MTNQEKCVFCQIAAKKIPAFVRYEDAEIIAFDDNNPSAPIHILIIPKRHITSLTNTKESDVLLLGKLIYQAKLLAEQLNISDTGYRVSINVGEWGGQIIPHLHIHLIGGAPLSTSRELLAKAEKPIILVRQQE